MANKKIVRLYDEATDSKKTYFFPSGAIATTEALKKNFPCLSSGLKVVLILDALGETIYTVQSLSSLADAMGIDPTRESELVLADIEAQVNKEPEEPMPTPEERIAAALEFQNMMAMSASA